MMQTTSNNLVWRQQKQRIFKIIPELVLFPLCF